MGTECMFILSTNGKKNCFQHKKKPLQSPNTALLKEVMQQGGKHAHVTSL